MSKCMVNGERITPVSDEENPCLDILKDVDHVGGHVSGSITNKHYVHNEIWSLTCFQGAPSWYRTLSPADNKHPISLYLADTKGFVPNFVGGDLPRSDQGDRDYYCCTM